MFGTHNSGTGEPSKCLCYWFLTPFAKCQKDSIINQVKKGARFLDLRVRNIDDNYLFCHGLWVSKSNLKNTLTKVDNYLIGINDSCKVLITYEGKLQELFAEVFRKDIEKLMNNYSKLELVQVCVKKPVWKVLKSYLDVSFKQGFKALDFTSWHTLIPIPWFWDKVLGKPADTENEYTLVDFY